MPPPKARVFWPLLVALWCADCATKQWAETHLAPEHVPHSVFGDVVRLTLAHNPGAAMNFSLAPFSRVGFFLLAVLAIAVMIWMYLVTPAADRLRAAALALVVGGAAGNLLSRFLTPAGVTDFIDVGIRRWRFWTFNVADAGITIGALLLLSMLGDERGRARLG
jgi:signal peptidase II